MTNLSGTHLVSISHDPLDAPQERSRSWSSYQTDVPRHDSAPMRPLLLAGAIGLFAAWVVSGLGPQRRMSHAGGEMRMRRFAPRQRAGTHTGTQTGNRMNPRASMGVGPEGPATAQELSLDAMNP